MTERTLQVTYRKGRPFAAYLYLSRQTGAKSSRTTASAVTLERVNVLLAELGQPPLAERDFSFVMAA